MVEASLVSDGRLTVPPEHPAVAAFRQCLHDYASDRESLRTAVMRCASAACGIVPPETLIKVVREELPVLAGTHAFDYWRAKTDVVDWLLTAYYGPRQRESGSERES